MQTGQRGVCDQTQVPQVKAKVSLAAHLLLCLSRLQEFATVVRLVVTETL